MDIFILTFTLDCLFGQLQYPKKTSNGARSNTFAYKQIKLYEVQNFNNFWLSFSRSLPFFRLKEGNGRWLYHNLNAMSFNNGGIQHC